MKSTTTLLLSTLITLTSFAQNSLELDVNKYAAIEEISKVDLNKKHGIVAEANQAVFREDSVKGGSVLSHYICLTTVENGYLVYLLKLTDLELDQYIVADQFFFKSNLKQLYFNTLGCKPRGEKARGNVFAIQGGNVSDNELVKHFFTDHEKGKIEELGTDANYCESNEYMHVIKQD